ncbi:unnamed protein product [Phytophthora fragariaefolia]|uniref:Unnamed protein product n=1 Tax=Phytophthora fragariaefolia TaxID=1490495 RepID=A0A9W6UBM5_9STRA|nr:unnamed protein product [Phytophthora fragariaefolia]
MTTRGDAETTTGPLTRAAKRRLEAASLREEGGSPTGASTVATTSTTSTAYERTPASICMHQHKRSSRDDEQDISEESDVNRTLKLTEKTPKKVTWADGRTATSMDEPMGRGMTTSTPSTTEPRRRNVASGDQQEVNTSAVNEDEVYTAVDTTGQTQPATSTSSTSPASTTASSQTAMRTTTTSSVSRTTTSTSTGATQKTSSNLQANEVRREPNDFAQHHASQRYGVQSTGPAISNEILQLTDDEIAVAQKRSRLVQRLVENGKHHGMRVLEHHGLALIETMNGR